MIQLLALLAIMGITGYAFIKMVAIFAAYTDIPAAYCFVPLGVLFVLAAIVGEKTGIGEVLLDGVLRFYE